MKYGWVISAICVLVLVVTSPVLAGPTQEEVFRSIEQNVGEKVDGGRMLALLVAAVGVLILLAFINQRMKRQAVPKALNHHKRLLKEVSQSLGLKAADVKRLKSHADEVSYRSGENIASPGCNSRRNRGIGSG